MTLRESSAALLDGTVTARDLLSSAVRPMGATRHLNAFVGGVLPDAESSADASDARYRAGAPLSTLDGAPIAVKDNRAPPRRPHHRGFPRALRGFSSPVASTVTSRLGRRRRRPLRQDQHGRVRHGLRQPPFRQRTCVSPWMARPARDVSPDGLCDPSGRARATALSSPRGPRRQLRRFRGGGGLRRRHRRRRRRHRRKRSPPRRILRPGWPETHLRPTQSMRGLVATNSFLAGHARTF